MKKRKKHTVFAVFLVVCMVVGCNTLDQSAEITLKDTDVVEAFEISAWGEVNYSDVYQLNIDFPAIIQTIDVKEGDWVTKGQHLASLDMTEFNDLIDKMENSKTTGVSVLNNTYQDISGIEAQIVQIKNEISLAEKDVSNYRELYNNGAVSLNELDQYITILNKQQTNLHVLEVQLEQMKKNNNSNIDIRTNELDSVSKDLQINLNKKNKDYLDGSYVVCNLENAIVKNINVKYGSLLRGAGIAVMELIDADSTYISAEVEEEFIKDIDFEAMVRIIPTMNPELELTGKISQISSMAVEKDGNRIIKVQVIPNDPERVLKPGYTAEVYFGGVFSSDMNLSR